MEPTIININNIKYYNADELKEYDIAFFAKTSKTIRQVIERKNIPKEEYSYFCFNKKENKWKESNKDKPSAKAKLLIKEEWSKQNIPKFNENIKNEYEEAPPILELKEEEKFKDINNKSLDIEVRGERNVNKCYFKGKDIEKVFEVVKFQSNIIRDYSSYVEGEHYKFFITKKSSNGSKNSSKKNMYMTYLGFTKLLFVSRNKNATIFQKWSSKILFTHQLGTKEQRKKLSNKLLGIPVKDAKETFKKSSSSISFFNFFFESEFT